MPKKVIEIEVHTVVTDNHDGGFTVEIFNTQDELLKSLQEDYIDDELTIAAIEADEYEYGYLGIATLKLVADSKGNYKLAEKLSFHGGQ